MGEISCFWEKFNGYLHLGNNLGSKGHPFFERGCHMDFLHSETRKNLARSFAGEAQARSRYSAYAQVARAQGQEWIARVFEETAANEAVHAERFLQMLCGLGGGGENLVIQGGYPFVLGDTGENLAAAAAGEREEHDSVYPAFAELARREGFEETARLWMQIARVEGSHHLQFQSLAEQLRGGTLTEKPEPVRWRCLHCGYVYEGRRACDPCPICGKAAGWQQGQENRKGLLGK